MRLLAYDFEALVRMAQQAPWRDGIAEARLWAGDVRRTARPETGFGRDRQDGAREFDVESLDRLMTRLEAALERLGGDKALRDLLGDFPGKALGNGYDGWQIYEDLVRLWTSHVSAKWTDAHLLAADGAGSLLGPLGTAMGRDMRLAPYSPFCIKIGKPYPVPWRDKPRARIYHLGTEYLDALCEIGTSHVERAASVSRRSPEEVATCVGALIRHCELARQFDLVVAIDPDDAFWS